MSTPDKPPNQPLHTHTKHTVSLKSRPVLLLTHGKEWDPQQRRVELPIRYKEDPCSRDVGDADGQHAEEAQERLPPQAVPHGAGDGGGQEHQHQADQHLPFGQHARLVEVPPQAEGGE